MPASLYSIGATWDIALFLVLAAGAFFWGASRGNNKIKFLIVAAYIAEVLFALLPLAPIEQGLALASRAVLRMSIFGSIVILLAMFLRKIFRSGDTSRGAWWQTLLLSTFAAGFLMSNLLAQITPGSLTLSATSIQLFTGSAAKLWWTVLPIIGVIFL